ncbi:hypothetical protein MMC08_006709 [Hypocenomyce scalaris]|nr:hypothetical protein [Hypocenomyce scalaris]
MASLADIGRLSLDDASRSTKYEKGFAEFALTGSHDLVSFSEREDQILALHDQLEELRLEVALSERLKIQPAGEHDIFRPLDRVLIDLGTVDGPTSDDNIVEQLNNAEREYLESRSAYLLKNSIVESILVTDPILKAVHSGANATPAERYGSIQPRRTVLERLLNLYRSLHPLIDRRDVLSITHANLTSNLTTVMNGLTLAEAQNITLSRKNRALTETLLDLTTNLQTQRPEDISNPKLRSHLHDLKEETKTSRARWRIMKSVIAAVIVGSGIDWARNNELRELVLDDDEGPI